MGLCIIMLKHEVMVEDEWHDNGLQDLVTVSLCIQIGINKMQLCSLCVASACLPACPYHNPTMGHSVHNVDISKPLAHTMPYTLSAICPVQLRLGFIREDHTSPACQWPSKVSICPIKLVMTPNCSQVKTLVRTTSTQMSFPETVIDSLCRNSSLVQTHSSISYLGGWSQTIQQVRKPDVEALCWHGYMWSVVVRPVGHTAKSSKTTLEVAYGREMNIPFSGNSSGGHSCSQHANCTLPQNLRHLWHCAVTKLHILEWPFVPSTRYTYVMIMLFNQLLDMPHLSGGWMIFAKEKCSLTGM
jgi:hypothetical protein